MAKWKTLETHTIFKNQWFDIKENKVQMTDELAVEGVVTLMFADWVNVIAIDEKKSVILQRNYRHGAAVEVIETPSGSIEETDKSPMEAARRELYEETGYAAGKMILLGKSFANAQLQNNMVHHYLALDCKLVSQPKPEIEGVSEFWLDSFDKSIERIQKGEIVNSYIVEGLLRAYIYLQKQGK